MVSSLFIFSCKNDDDISVSLEKFSETPVSNFQAVCFYGGYYYGYESTFSWIYKSAEKRSGVLYLVSGNGIKTELWSGELKNFELQTVEYNKYLGSVDDVLTFELWTLSEGEFTKSACATCKAKVTEY